MPLLNEKDFKNILDGMVDGVITINQKGIILTFNKSAETIFGYKGKEVIGQSINMLMPEPDSSAHDSYLNRHVSTGENHIIGIGREVTALRKSGETFPMLLSVIEYPSKIENDRWFIGSCLDISLQKQQEEQLNRSLKMEAIGKLTSGIAHDYNNALGIILGYSEILEEQTQLDPELMRYIKQIKKATSQAVNLTKQLLSISRKRTDSNEEIQINNILSDNQEILTKTLTARIKLTITKADDLWPCFIDKSCLEDSILNLSINAMHAMPEGGTLDITTSNIQIGPVDAQVLNLTKGDYVKITIADSGIGMTPDVISHIFDPFYTTKGEEGTGLGLSQVFNFINRSSGAIRVYSEPGYGTRFSIFLPHFLQNTLQGESENLDSKVEEQLNGTASILIVDDEEDIRKMTEEVLSSHGYKTFSASSAENAITLIKNEKIDVVVSDVIMPDMDGFELAHFIHHTYPDIKIQLCSGFPKPIGKSVTNKTLLKNILEKPFTSKQLLTKVQKVLIS